MTTTPLTQPQTITATGKSSTRRGLGLVLRYVPLLILLFIFVFPLVFMIVSSFKGSNQQIFSDLRSVRAFLPVGDLTLGRDQDVIDHPAQAHDLLGHQRGGYHAPQRLRGEPAVNLLVLLAGCRQLSRGGLPGLDHRYRRSLDRDPEHRGLHGVAY